jgi:hypothetical protein
MVAQYLTVDVLIINSDKLAFILAQIYNKIMWESAE